MYNQYEDPNLSLIRTRKPSEKRTLVTMLAIGILLLSGLIQVINWDKYSLKVIPLQASVLFGSMTAESYAEFAKICLERQKTECALNSLKNQVRLSPDNQEALLQLGLLQVKMEHLESATQTLNAYLEAGGTAIEAKFHLARAYGKLDNTKEALKIYKELLGQKSNVFQVSVTREYIQTLMRAKKWSLAKSTIERARLKSASHNAFMNAEYKYIISKTGRRNLASH